MKSTKEAKPTSQRLFLGKDNSNRGEFDWINYYNYCRDSCHNLAQKFLTLLFQYVTFCVASVSIIGLLFEKVDRYVALGVSALSIFGSIYFLVMVQRYFDIVGNLSDLCERVERDKIFGTIEQASQFGIFHVIAKQSDFYLSRRIKFVVKLFSFTLLMIVISTFIAIFISL